MSSSDAVRDTASRLVSLPESGFVPALNEALRELFPGFHVDSAAIRDSAGTQTPVFETVISVKPIVGGLADADAVACAICAYHALDETKLKEGFERIAEAKSLKKAPPTHRPQSTVTLGVVVAAQGSLSLSRLAACAKEITVTFPHNRLPDMIAVLSRGVISYAVRFSGNRAIMERLPSQEDERKWAAPMLTHLTTTATTSYAFNKFVGYLAGQLKLFAPNAAIPDMQKIIEGVPSTKNIVATYQENLAVKLVEIQEVAPIERPPYIVESDQGELLNRLYYQPWQDGGVILTEGRLPIEAFLPLMQIFTPMAFRPTPTRNLSAVLPLSLEDFRKAVEEIPRHCNLKVKLQKQQFTVGKLMDEGTSAPFVARLWLTPLNMRDTVIVDPAVKQQFDTFYQAIITDLSTLRRIAKETIALWKSHEAKVASGEIGRYTNAIQIDEIINEPLNHGIETIIKTAAGAVKQSQDLTKLLGIDTGFMFQKQPGFEAGVAALDATDSALADYLWEARKWSDPVQNLRNDYEHNSYVAPPVNYDRTPEDGVRAIETPIMGMPLTGFIPILVNRTNRYIEEVLMWCYQRMSPFPIGEIPIAKRDPDKPERFRFLYNPGEQVWVIIYSDDEFDRA